MGLSEVINHLLGRDGADEALQAIPFDFLVHGHMLRSSLQKYLAANPHISTENILLVEYMPALRIGDDGHSQETDSWIGSILAEKNSIITATYDGRLQHHDGSSLEVVGVKLCHDMPIRSIASIAIHDEAAAIATASKDQTIKLWKMISNSSSGCPFIQTHCLKGHGNSVESLCGWTASSRNLVLSGDWSGNLMGWNLSASMRSQDQDMSAEDKKTKKRKGSLGSALAAGNEVVEVTMPSFTIRAHSQAVTDLVAHVESGVLDIDCLSHRRTLRDYPSMMSPRSCDGEIRDFASLSAIRIPVLGCIANHANRIY